jgi:hypothetical protein
MTTPLGSEVAPDVKMIPATSSRLVETGGRGVRHGPLHLVQEPDVRGGCVGGRAQRRDVLTDEHQLGRHNPADPPQKVGRRSVVDRDHDHAAQETAPERRNPLRPVLTPEDCRIALAETGLVNPPGEGSGHAGNCPVRVAAAPEAVVVHQKVAAR